ncbi:MAG: DUF389 domain-containing protein [Hymenobacter sp.]
MGNVVPGVAIATALMPPLCTAGYGLATAHWAYLFGALYLFSINCVFISLATFLVCPVPAPAAPRVLPKAPRQAGARQHLGGGAAHGRAERVPGHGHCEAHGMFTHNAQQLRGGAAEPARHLRRHAPHETRRYIPSTCCWRASASRRRSWIRPAPSLQKYRLTGIRLTVRQGLAGLDSADARALRTSLLEDVRSRKRASDGRLRHPPGPASGAAARR